MPSCATATTWSTPSVAFAAPRRWPDVCADLEDSLRPDVAPAFHSVKADRSCLPAVADTVRRFHIPAEHLRAVLDGVEMDLDRPRYETFADWPAIASAWRRRSAWPAFTSGDSAARRPSARPAPPASPCN